MRIFPFVFTIIASLWPFIAHAGSLQHTELQQKLNGLSSAIDGRLGVCVQDSSGMSCLKGDERFSLQSVVKLITGIAVLQKVDHGGWKLTDPVVVHREDLSLYVQPISKLVSAQGYRTTLGDLIRRAVVDSDSAANDILMARLGGPKVVQSCLDNFAIKGIRVDRDERHLQTEIVGLSWRAEFVEATLLEKAITQVPKNVRDEKYRAYQKDVRDTSTPRGMAALLFGLASGKLLSAASTRYILDVMSQTVTFPDRLKAGISDGWSIGHKTGSSGAWNGITAATNDVGVLTAPDGGIVSVAVFAGDSNSSAKDKAAVMAKIAAAAIASYRSAK